MDKLIIERDQIRSFAIGYIAAIILGIVLSLIYAFQQSFVSVFYIIATALGVWRLKKTYHALVDIDNKIMAAERSNANKG